MKTRYEIVVLGGTPGGIASAVRAAREGCSTILITYNKHLGGMMAGGLSYTDTLTMKSRAPIMEEFFNKVREYYSKKYGRESEQYKLSENGYIFEPHVAEKIFEELVTNQNRLDVVMGYYPTKVERDGRNITSVKFQPFNDIDSNFSIAGNIFIEATYEGDLMAKTGVEYRVGRESRSEFGEQLAGQIFTQIRDDRYYPLAAVGNEDDGATEDRWGPLDVPKNKRKGDLDLIPHPAGLTEIYPGSTGRGDNAIQAFNYRLCLSKDPENRRQPEKPSNYERTTFLPQLENIKEVGLRAHLTLRFLPNKKADMNAADLAGKNHDYPEASWEKRQEVREQHRDYALGLLYFLQNDEAVPDPIQDQAKEWGLALDEFQDNDNFPWQFYIRESRRLEGRYTFTENDARLAPGLDRTPINEDSIAITEYPLDSHACHSKTQLGSKSEGFFFASQVTRPAQVPYKALLPKGVDNLLVPVPLSASHVGYGSIRLEPTWFHIGEASGVAAALAREEGTMPSSLDVTELQQRLVDSDTMLTFFNDCDMALGEPWVPAVQFLGTKGFFSSYDAYPGAGLGKNTAEYWAKRVEELQANKMGSATEFAQSISDQPSGPQIKYNTFANLLESKCNDVNIEHYSQGTEINRGEACRIIYDILKSKN